MSEERIFMPVLHSGLVGKKTRNDFSGYTKGLPALYTTAFQAIEERTELRRGNRRVRRQTMNFVYAAKQ